jgi:hypothetical protein
MASQSTEPTSAGRERIAFEVEGMEQTAPGRVEVRGRWLGVRGRRFFRPALTVTVDGRERRALADLEDKPWAPEQPEAWRAVFPLKVELAKATAVELSVAPDITVKLIAAVRAQSSRRRGQTPDLLRAPRVPPDPVRPGPMLSERAQQVERMNSRLITMGQELERERSRAAAAAEEVQRLQERWQSAQEEMERERSRRAGSEEELERQRSETLGLRARLGRLQAELELARVAQSDSASASAKLDEMRLALDRERAEAKQLRSQLAEARERIAAAVQRAAASESSAQSPSPATSPRRDTVAVGDATEPRQRLERLGRLERSERSDRSDRGRRRARPDGGDPSEPRDRADRHKSPEHPRSSEHAQDRDRPERADRSARPDRSAPVRPPERPLNPSLRHRTYWVGRVLAVLFILAVVAAIVLVIRTTMSA